MSECALFVPQKVAVLMSWSLTWWSYGRIPLGIDVMFFFCCFVAKIAALQEQVKQLEAERACILLHDLH